MATDNLPDHFAEVADAIRAVDGTTGKINPQDFASRILALAAGGGVSDHELRIFFDETKPAELYGGTWEKLSSNAIIKDGTEQWTDENWFVGQNGCTLASGSEFDFGSVMKKRNSNEHYFNLQLHLSKIQNGLIIGKHLFTIKKTARYSGVLDPANGANVVRVRCGVEIVPNGDIAIYFSSSEDVNQLFPNGAYLFGIAGVLLEDTSQESYTVYIWRKAA